MSLNLADFAARAETIILSQSAPFISLDEASRNGLSHFLSEEIEIGGLTKARFEHAQAGDSMGKFDLRLAFLGAVARQAGLDRYSRSAAHRESVDDFGALAHSDLTEGFDVVGRVSGTLLCEPG